MTVVISLVIMSALYTILTLRSIEKNLPNTLLKELNLLSTALERVSDVVTASKIAKEVRTEQNIITLRKKIDIAQSIITELRETYVFDNLVNASHFHAVTAPVIADLHTWLSEGVSGYLPTSTITLGIAELRVKDAYQKAWDLNTQSQLKAQTILNNQKIRLEKLQKSVSALFILTLLVVSFLIFFLFRQTYLIKRETHTKNELREQRDLLQSLLKNVPLGIVVWDKDKRIVHLNDKFTETTGYDQTDMATLEMWPRLAYPDPQYRREVRNHWEGLDKSKSAGEYKVNCKNGEVKDIEFRATFLADSRVINTLTDVTERNVREQALQESHKIEARAKKMESLGLLAGGVAHDLNNILSGIVSYPDLILLELEEHDKTRQAIEIMRDSGQKAAAIVQDLLTVARGVAIAKEALNLNSVINDYLASPDFQLLKKHHPNVSFNISLDDNLKNIMGSRVHLQKILMNLISNGSEAIDHSGEVLIATSWRHIDTPFKGYEEVEEGEYVLLSVADQGGGVPEADLDRIFEPFFTKKVMGRSGTGLGLAVVWNVVQDHNGYINVVSSSNGTTFSVFLPVTEKNILPSISSYELREVEGAGETILVVDDISSQRIISARILEKLRYRVLTVSSGEEAVEFLNRNRVDLLLLDMIMDPGINGRQTYKRILETNDKQKAIIVSGFAETDDVKETLNLGASCFLKKPLNIYSLGIAVQKVLQEKR